jgi:hypothetical protein
MIRVDNKLSTSKTRKATFIDKGKRACVLRNLGITLVCRGSKSSETTTLKVQNTFRQSGWLCTELKD